MIVVWTERAKASLQAIFEHVAADDFSAAERLLDVLIDETDQVLTNQPTAGRPGRVDGTREWVAHKSYIIAYRVGKTSQVEVLDVIHASRLWPGSF